MNVSIKKRLISHCCAIAIIAFSFFSCQEMNKWDDPAGNQVYPNLEKLGSFTFEQEIDPEIMQLSSYNGGDTPVVEKDVDHGGNVLHMDGGYARISNSLTKVKVQNGVSFTFWMKQNVPSGQEQDLTGALFSFQNENGSPKTFLTANGWLSYDGADGKYEDNNPSAQKTGIITANEWHYVAVAVRNDGYAIYVDGEEKINKKIVDFDFSKIVQSMASASYLYIGYGSNTETREWMVDDLTIYRNQITETQIKVPDTGGGGDNKDYIIVGNEDFSTTWWSAFSDLVKMTDNKTTHIGFYNYTNGANNWNNWVLVVTNGKNRGEEGYAEYFVLRADAFGWGDGNYKGENISHNFNFSDGSFVENMKGAYVDLSIKRTNNRIDVTAVVTAKSGTVYNYTFFYEGVTTSDVGSFLTCEGAYLAIDPETVYVGNTYAPNAYLVGAADYSAGWWSAFSDFSKISGNTTSPFVYTFYNYTNGNANWNNWVLVVTNGKNRGEDGYAEYFVLRSDAFGWGDSNYNGANITHGFDFGTFISNMKGAYCMIILTRSGNRVDMKVRITTADGVKLSDYTFYYEGVTTPDIGSFLTVEGASLNMRTVGYYPFLNK